MHEGEETLNRPNRAPPIRDPKNSSGTGIALKRDVLKIVHADPGSEILVVGIWKGRLSLNLLQITIRSNHSTTIAVEDAEEVYH